MCLNFGYSHSSLLMKKRLWWRFLKCSPCDNEASPGGIGYIWNSKEHGLWLKSCIYHLPGSVLGEFTFPCISMTVKWDYDNNIYLLFKKNIEWATQKCLIKCKASGAVNNHPAASVLAEEYGSMRCLCLFDIYRDSAPWRESWHGFCQATRPLV